MVVPAPISKMRTECQPASWIGDVARQWSRRRQPFFDATPSPHDVFLQRSKSATIDDSRSITLLRRLNQCCHAAHHGVRPFSLKTKTGKDFR
jgi:hypothetical protein